MRILLDSNVLLWALGARDRLSSRVLAALQDDSNVLVLSPVSVWEISIKTARGKLPLPGGSVLSLLEQVDRLGIELLPIERQHVLRTERLPDLHRDPFDRMIIAQALCDDLPILTADPFFSRYGVAVIWN